MEIYVPKDTAEHYFRELIGRVEKITRKWSVVLVKKDHVEQFLMTVSIDYSAQEIQEIREAVVELLTRYKDKINDRERYKICRIEGCGSMREDTATWKSGTIRLDTRERQSWTYTEFGYLGVLEKPCRYKININPRKCCAEVKKSYIDKPCSCEVPNCSRGMEPDKPRRFNEAFKEELCKSVESLCDCYSMYPDEQRHRYIFRQKFREQQQGQKRGCDKCTVYKPTGQLHIDTEIEGTFPHSSYSLKLMWTSDAVSLVAPEGDITDKIKTSPIKRLLILIDFLPALEVVNTQKNEGELEHEYFLVPKRCHPHYLDGTWKLSGCVREIDHIVNKMSEKHKKSYKILKHMCGRRIPSYHTKTLVLNHCVTCSDSSEDYRNCVTAVLEELKIAYERRVLESFCYKFNLLEDSDKGLVKVGGAELVGVVGSDIASPVSEKGRLQFKSNTGASCPLKRSVDIIYSRYSEERIPASISNGKALNIHDEYLDYLRSRITGLSKKIILVWTGYKMTNQYVPVFIAVMQQKDIDLDTKFKELYSFELIQKLPDEVSEEAKRCLHRESSLKFSVLEQTMLYKTIAGGSEELMHKHSNLLIVSASKIRSRKLGEETDESTCVVFYVHVKGIIPWGEKPFPVSLGNYPVDVREGVFSKFSKLQMGCEIRGATMKGRLGGFVRLSDEKVGCFTCSHIFCNDDQVFVSNVFQSTSESHQKPFGKVTKRVNFSGNNEMIGVDAALIEIQDRLQIPDDNTLDASPDMNNHGLEFFTGEILTSAHEIAEISQESDAKCIIVKYNNQMNTTHITTGSLKTAGATVRAWYPVDPNEACQLWLQIEVQPSRSDYRFAEEGDSGSLVFLVSEKNRKTWAIGMVVGGIPASGAGIITPIWAILDHFKLPKKLICFNNHLLKKILFRLDGIESFLRQLDDRINKTSTS